MSSSSSNPTASTSSGLSLAEAVCLTLVAREPRHGWAIVKTLAPEGEIGRVEKEN